MSEQNIEKYSDEYLKRAVKDFIKELLNEENLNKESKPQNNKYIQIKKKELKNIPKKNQKSKQNKSISQPKNKIVNIHPFPQTTVKKRNMKIKTNDINNQNLFQHEFTKSSNLTKSAKEINNPKKNKKLNHTININSSTDDIFKAKQDSTKEKKLYEEKVKILRNHINALKLIEIELNKQAEQAKEREINKKKIKQEKENLKKILL